MNTTPRFIAALALAGAFASTTLSAAESGPYIRLENGVSSISGANVKIGPVSAGILGSGRSEKIKFKPGYTFGGAAGYRFNDSLAAEVELDYARNKVDTVGGVTPQTALQNIIPNQGSVNFRQTSLLASGVYSHKLAEAVSINAGGGLGVQFSSVNLAEGTVGGYTGKRKSDAAFLAQLKTGFSVALANNLSFDAGYKLRFVSSSDIYEGTAPTGESEKLTIDSRLNHVFSAGFTYAF